MTARYPRLKSSARMKKLPTGVRIAELYTQKSGLLNVKAAYVLSLCTGAVGTDVIARCLNATFGDTVKSARSFVERVLNECAPLLEVFDEPVRGDFRYDFADFAYVPKKPGPRYESPASGQLVLTNRCNFRCEYCFNSSGPDRPNEMPGEIWIKLARQMRDLNVAEVALTGGEPLMAPGFGLILDACAEADMLITVYTNGSLITPEWAERFARIENLIVQVSIDTPYEDVFDRVTGSKGRMGRVIDAVRLLVDAGVYTRCKALIMPETMDGARELIRLCEKMRVKSLMLDTFDLSYVGRGGNRFFMRPEDSANIRKLVEEESARLKGAMGLEYAQARRLWANEKDIVACGAMSDSFTILPNGDFTLCEKTAGDPNCLIGRFPEMSLGEMWSSPRIEEVMRPRREAYQEPCGGCEHLENCRGGCPAAARLVSDMPHAADPRCWKARYERNPYYESRE